LQELYFRHLYAKTQPSLRARCESWDNYCDLFGVILHGAQQQPQQWRQQQQQQQQSSGMHSASAMGHAAQQHT
jgi:hypothetical protein